MPYWQTVWRSIQDLGLIKYRRIFHQPDTVHISPTSPAEKQINFMDKYLSTFLLQYFKIFEFYANSQEIQLSNRSGEIGKHCLLLVHKLTKLYFSGLLLILSGFSALSIRPLKCEGTATSRVMVDTCNATLFSFMQEYAKAASPIFSCYNKTGSAPLQRKKIGINRKY